MKERRLDSAPLFKRAIGEARRVSTGPSLIQPISQEQLVSSFHHRIRPAVQAELESARRAEQLGDAPAAFECLERAHVLGQPSTRLHTTVHWLMLRWAIRQRDVRELVGQVFRIVAAATKTAFGWLPHGNTGGTHVSAFRPMPVAPELQRVIDAARR
jgi:hypothetical protein